MLRGLYTAASGMTTQQRRHDAITNNIANLNTPGFKGSNTVSRTFPDMLLSAMGGPEGTVKPIGRPLAVRSKAPTLKCAPMIASPLW